MSRAIADLERGNDGWVIHNGYMSYESSTIGANPAFLWIAAAKPFRTIQFSATPTGTCPVRIYIPHKRGLTAFLIGSITGVVTPTIKREYVEYNMAGGETWAWTLTWLPA